VLRIVHDVALLWLFRLVKPPQAVKTMELDELKPRLDAFCRHHYRAGKLTMDNVFNMPRHAGFHYGFSISIYNETGVRVESLDFLHWLAGHFRLEDGTWNLRFPYFGSYAEKACSITMR